MLKLIVDLKCGYENKYIVLKNYEYDLSFLFEPIFYKGLALMLNKPVSDFENISEESVYNTYHSSPDIFIKEFQLGQLILRAASTEVATIYFRENTIPEQAPVIFPELFTISNSRIVFDKAIGQDSITDELNEEDEQNEDNLSELKCNA